VVVVEVSTAVDVVVWTTVPSVVDDVEDDVVGPKVVVPAVSVAQAPLMINKASPAANDAQDLISAPLGVLILKRRAG
ncbi:MAG: hypothetical protein ACRDWF_14395, partial [Acidimicrobiia bacterium]